MSSFGRRHPEDLLVRYFDGELSARRARQVEGHLRTCLACRNELQELENTVAECARYRQSVVQQHLPEPPLAWRDLYQDFSRIDESLAHVPLLVRLVRPLVHAGAPRWAMAAVSALLVVLGVLYQLRQTPSVQAATLLRKAVAAAAVKPRPVHRIRVRTAQQEFTRFAGPQAPVIQAASVPALEALFETAHYDWTDPLSARSFQQWRDAQSDKTDQVSAVAGGTEIRTTAATGEIAEASITLDAGYSPVAERLEFRDREWVELTEIADPSTSSDANAVAANSEVPVRPAEPPSRPAAFPPRSSASISDELQVLSALNGIGADLGDPVDVALAGGKVVVNVGVGISADHQRKIEALESPLVEVRVHQPQPVLAPPAGAATPDAGNTPVPAIQSRVERQLGGRVQFERFSAQILESDEAAMARVYALRALAQKFPVETEAQLSSQDRELLNSLSREHAAVLSQKVSALENLLLPTLSSLGGTAALVHAPAAHTAWQPAVEDLFRASGRVEKLVSVLLGATPIAGSTAALPSELVAALKDLDANLRDFDRLVPSK